MSVQYKQSGTWKDVSSGSNNAVDTVADGNMNPVTSNAVYDALAPIGTTVVGSMPAYTAGTTSVKSTVTIGEGTWIIINKSLFFGTFQYWGISAYYDGTSHRAYPLLRKMTTDEVSLTNVVVLTVPAGKTAQIEWEFSDDATAFGTGDPSFWGFQALRIK